METLTNTSGRHAKTFIERDLPIEELSPIVAKEANARKPIYQIHKWWARRLGSIFRALIIASFSKSNESRERLWSKYCSHRTVAGKIILDPMMGGGVSIVEGLRLGCKVVGADINPVAWFITKKEIEPLDFTEINKWFVFLHDIVGKEIREFYHSCCSSGHDADILYTIWGKYLNCKNCSTEILLMQDYVISEKKEKRTVLCPKCFGVFETHAREKTTCPDCHHIIRIRNGTVRRGVVTCPHCRKKERVIDAVKRYEGPLPLRMLCIEYYCSECGRGYKKPDFSDLQKYELSKRKWERMKDSLPYPKEAIPKSKTDPRPMSHGYVYFYELFNPRQLLSLSLLLKGIMQVNDRSIREFLLLAFSTCLETNNLLCKYESKWMKLSSCFSIPAFHPAERVAENNVWGTEYGRGTFVKCYQKLLRAKTPLITDVGYCNSRNKKTGSDVQSAGFTELANSFEELISSGKNALLTCDNSEYLSYLPNDSIDLVLTDPPYFDNLNYSRLADFFFVWIRKCLSQDYAEFKRRTSAHEGEIVMDGTRERNIDRLVESLGRVLSECNRVLRREGLMVFTFHHNKGWAWKGLAQALSCSGFSVASTQYIRSEGRTGFRKGGNISYDACITCRKGNGVLKHGNLECVQRSASKWVRRLKDSGNSLRRSDVQCVVMGELLNYSPSTLMSDLDLEVVNRITDQCVQVIDKPI